MILAAAAREFLEHGYGATSTAAVSRRAGLSKRTIYEFFTSKAALLEAIMVERRKAFLLSIDTGKVDELPLDQALDYILGRFARMILAEDSLALYRLITGEAQNFPEIASAFYLEGPARSYALLGEILQRLQARGLLRLNDPATTASMLLSMIAAEPMRTAALGLTTLPTQDEIDTRVKTAIEIFLNGCAAHRQSA